MKNVIVVVFDSVRQDHLSCYGYPRDTSPNIDALAKKGSCFNARVSEPINPITKSSAYGMLSGQSQQVLTADICPHNLPLLQQVVAPSLLASNHLLLFSGTKWNVGFKYGYLMEANPAFFRPCREITAWFMYWGLSGKPRFSLLWFNETHSEYRFKEATAERFIKDDVPTLSGDIVLYNYLELKKTSPDNPNYCVDFRKHMAQYDAAIHNLDGAIGPILALADDDTLIIVCSDHGDYMGEFGHWFTHAWRDDHIPVEQRPEALRQARDVLRPIFMVMSQPSPRNGGEATILDLAPTVAEWLDVQPLDFWEGKSLL